MRKKGKGSVFQDFVAQFMQKMHIQFQKSCQKSQKCIFNFEIHTKKGKRKKEGTFFNCFALIKPSKKAKMQKMNFSLIS